MSLIAELKRRNVIKVSIAYLTLGWVVTEVTGTVAPAMGLPDWTLKLVILIGLIGFPFVVVFSWVYELTPEGLRRESEVDRSASITPLTSRRLDYIIIAMLALAMGLFALDRFGAPDAAAPMVIAPPAVEAKAPAPQAAAQRRVEDKSIAVLPFLNMSSDAEQEYFSDGLSEELLNLLAKIPELRVIARTSSFAFKGKEVGIATVAEKLQVAHVLEGSVRKSGDRVRITAQLIRASDSSHLWSDTYDRTLEDIFAVQDEIAQAVVTQLKLTLLGAAPKAHQTDPAAYALYLQARQNRLKATSDALREALDLVQKSLAIDPAYTESVLELSRIYAAQAGSEGMIPFADGFRLAQEAANEALRLDPGSAGAHAALGSLVWQYEGDAARSAQHIERALELDPVSFDALGTAADLSLGLGRLEQALALASYRQQRDPMNPGGHAMLAYINLYGGNLEQAILSRRNAIALNPEGGAGHYFVGVALLLQGKAAAAVAEFEQERSEVWRRIGLAMGQHAAGNKTASDALLAELVVKDADSWAYNIAYVQAIRGEADAAFEWLDKAVQLRDPGLSDVAVEPLLVSLHQDPRWLPFLRSIGRAPEQLAAVEFNVKLPGTP